MSTLDGLSERERRQMLFSNREYAVSVLAYRVGTCTTGTSWWGRYGCSAATRSSPPTGPGRSTTQAQPARRVPGGAGRQGGGRRARRASPRIPRSGGSWVARRRERSANELDVRPVCALIRPWAVRCRSRLRCGPTDGVVSALLGSLPVSKWGPSRWTGIWRTGQQQRGSSVERRSLDRAHHPPTRNSSSAESAPTVRPVPTSSS